jgi:hypothetical protein
MIFRAVFSKHREIIMSTIPIAGFQNIAASQSPRITSLPEATAWKILHCTRFSRGKIRQAMKTEGKISKRVGDLAQMRVFRQNLETEALATGAFHALPGQEEPIRYKLPSGLRK